MFFFFIKYSIKVPFTGSNVLFFKYICVLVFTLVKKKVGKFSKMASVLQLLSITIKIVPK